MNFLKFGTKNKILQNLGTKIIFEPKQNFNRIGSFLLINLWLIPSLVSF